MHVVLWSISVLSSVGQTAAADGGSEASDSRRAPPQSLLTRSPDNSSELEPDVRDLDIRIAQDNLVEQLVPGDGDCGVMLLRLP